jgi:hypothetical protein
MNEDNKRYLLFAGDYYYPCGGWEDFFKSYTSIEDATNDKGHINFNWVHIVDSQSGKIVKNW